MEKLKWFCNWYTLVLVGVLVGFSSFYSEYQMNNDLIIAIYSMIVTAIFGVVMGVLGFFSSDKITQVKEFIRVFWPCLVYSSMASIITVITCSLCLR